MCTQQITKTRTNRGMTNDDDGGGRREHTSRCSPWYGGLHCIQGYFLHLENENKIELCSAPVCIDSISFQTLVSFCLNYQS